MEQKKSIELKDTVDMMLSDDYKERFKAEYYQLSYRIAKLQKMLCDWDDGKLNFTPKCSFSMLLSQLLTMQAYQVDLEMRADIEDIELFEEVK